MALLTHLDIVNSACALIGAEPLQDLDEEVIGGQSASLLYEAVVDFNLGLEPFSFAHELRQLSAVDGPAPASGFATVFNVPGPLLSPPLWLTDDPTDPDRRFWRFAQINGQVHSDAPALWAFCQFRPEPYRWTATFRAATITAVAASFALSVASDRNLHDTLHMRAYGTPSEMKRGGEMRAAITTNALSTPPRRPGWDDNPLARAWRS